MLRNDLIVLLSQRDNDTVTVDVNGILIDVDAVTVDRGAIVIVLNAEDLSETLQKTASGHLSPERTESGTSAHRERPH